VDTNLECRICLLDAGIDAERYLSEYAASLPEDMKCSREEYERRLIACDGCAMRCEFTCRMCGCFVKARAMKKSMDCPHPAGSKWRT